MRNQNASFWPNAGVIPIPLTCTTYSGITSEQKSSGYNTKLHYQDFTCHYQLVQNQQCLGTVCIPTLLTLLRKSAILLKLKEFNVGGRMCHLYLHKAESDPLLCFQYAPHFLLHISSPFLHETAASFHIHFFPYSFTSSHSQIHTNTTLHYFLLLIMDFSGDSKCCQICG